jgi:hypothetical protein
MNCIRGKLSVLVFAALIQAFLGVQAAQGQPAIVGVDVKLEKPAFGDWNKPQVIRSDEDAAKHFDKEGLAALGKKVDLKKQIVLIFAWKGSGQDRLSYTVAESFPEQIAFSLKPGATDDLREHVHVFALRSNVKWGVRAPQGAQGRPEEAVQKENSAPTVRQLKFVAKDPTAIFNLGGKGKLTRLADAEAVEKLVGKDAAKSLIDAVDFTKEAIVLVSWSTSGPPDGKLQHGLKDKNLQFYVQGPPGGGARGQRLRIGADFFAVPRELNVTLDPKER